MDIYIKSKREYVSIGNAKGELLDEIINYLTRQRRELYRFDKNLKGATHALLQDIFRVCCSHFNLSQEDVKKKGNYPEAVRVRDVYCFLAREHSSAGLRQIGLVIDREPPNVFSRYKKMRGLLKGNLVDASLLADVEAVEKKIFTNKFSPNK